MPPPVPQPQKAAGRRIGGLPAWAWVAAIAGGLIVGFLFLRRADAAVDSEGTGSAAGPAARPPGGGAGAGLLPPELLEALGLTQPEFYGGGGDSGGTATGSSDPTPTSAATTTASVAPEPWYNIPYVAPPAPQLPGEPQYSFSGPTQYGQGTSSGAVKAQ